MLYLKTKKHRLFWPIIIGLFLITIAGIATFGAFSYLDVQPSINQQAQIKTTLEQVKKIAAAKEAKKKEPVYINLPGAQQIRAIVEDYSLQSSLWTLVSKTNSISTDYVPSPIQIASVATRTDKSEEERSVRSDIDIPLTNMFAAATVDGYELMIGSGYRSAKLQSTYFYSLANSVGETVANQTIARPGQSEHQTGLAVDISTIARNCYLDSCFGETADGQWLVENSYKFGFILRYPEDKVDITGYSYEPWHFRYVGIDLATALHESGLTLDEAWPYLVDADAMLKSNGAI